MKDTNISISKIEAKAISLYDEMIAQKKQKIGSVKDKLIDYIFGKTDDNPLESITSEYYKKMMNLRKKANEIAKTEKQSYVGKRKKSVKFVKKLKTDA